MLESASKGGGGFSLVPPGGVSLVPVGEGVSPWSGGVLLGLGGFSLVPGGGLLGPGGFSLVGGVLPGRGGSPWSGGVLLGPGGVLPGPEGVFSLVRGGSPETPPVNRMNDRHL